MFLAKIDVCRVRPCVIGRAHASLGVVGMLGEQFGMAGGRGGDVGVCALCVSQRIFALRDRGRLIPGAHCDRGRSCMHALVRAEALLTASLFIVAVITVAARLFCFKHTLHLLIF